MGLFNGFFGDNRQTTQSSNQSGSTTGNQSFGITPQIQAYAQSIGGIYDPSKYGDAWAGPNLWQTGAVAGNPGLFGQASNIASSGIDPSRISQFFNPYQQNVIDAYRQNAVIDYGTQSSGLNAQLAKVGALGPGSQVGNAQAILKARQAADMGSKIAGLQHQGFTTAADLAKQAASMQLAGIGAASGVLGQQFGQGSILQQNQQFGNLLPYQLAQQGGQTFSGLAQASGTNTSGTTQGTSTGTGSQSGTPSPFSILSNIAGLGIAAYSDERVKENIREVGRTHDGQKLYRYNYKGHPGTQIGLLAQEVEEHHPEAVGSVGGIKTVNYDLATADAARRPKRADGGFIEPYHADDPHNRLGRAFTAIRSMISRANGGPILAPYHGHADGGDVGMGSWSSTVTPAPSYDWGKLGKGFQDMAKPGASGGQSQDDTGAMLRDAQSSLSSRLSQLQQQTAPRMSFDSGGSVPWNDGQPVFAESGSVLPAYAGASRAMDERTISGRPTPTIGEPYAEAAAIRFNNPGAMYPGPSSRRYGSTGHEIIAGGHKIATFDDPVQGGAAQFHLLANSPDYIGRPVRDVIRTWSGGNNSDAYTKFVSDRTGLSPDAVLTPEMMANPSVAIPFAAAKARWETGKDYPMTDAQWREAHRLGLGSRMSSEDGAYHPAYPPWEVSGADSARSTPSGGTAEKPPRKASSQPWYKSILPKLDDGIWAGKEATPMQRLGIALMSVQSPTMNAPMNGVAANLMAIDKHRMDQARINQERDALLGTINGQQTLAATSQPSEIALREAQTAESKVRADKEHLLNIEKQKLEYAKALEIAKAEEQAKMVGRITRDLDGASSPNAGPQTRLRWTPTPTPTPSPSPAQTTNQTPAVPQQQGAAPISPGSGPSVTTTSVPQAQAPTTPAALSQRRREEARDRLGQATRAQIVENTVVRQGFEADQRAMPPVDFAAKYSELRGQLNSEQLRRLDAMIDRLTRGN